MKKMTHIFPIIALSTLLLACSSGGKGNGNHSPALVNSPISTPSTKGEKTAKQPTAETKPQSEEKPLEIASPAQPDPKAMATQIKPSTTEVAVIPTKEANIQASKAQEPTIEKVAPQSKPEKSVWSAASHFPYAKHEVPVIYLIENDKADAVGDPNFKEKQNAIIALQLGKNKDVKNHYLFYASDNAYYGFYRDSENMMSVVNKHVYSFDEKAENKADLSGLNATYNGKFIYSTRSIPELAMPAKLALRYKDGKAEGEIISHLYDDKLFEVKSTDNARTLELNPLRQLDNSWENITVKSDSPDRAFINVHFINGNDGKENQTLVGKGGNEKYWGVLGADKAE